MQQFLQPLVLYQHQGHIALPKGHISTDFGLELMKETRPWGKNWRYADMNENNSLILILGYDEKDCCYASMEVPELV